MGDLSGKLSLGKEEESFEEMAANEGIQPLYPSNHLTKDGERTYMISTDVISNTS